MILLGVALAAAIHGPAARYDSWKVIGPGGAGGMFLPTISPHDPSLVLEHCDMTGAYISFDAGRSWRMVRADAGTLYLLVSRRSDASFQSEAEDGGLYRSTDGAQHWTRMKLPAGVNGPTGLALDPTDNRRMYLTAWGGVRDGLITGGGVFLSTDGGGTWRNIFDESQHVYDVTVDPKNPKVLYNSGFESGAYRSTDGGTTWKKIFGFNFKWGHRVIPDPVDSGKIYVTTFGGSVWHGPATGDPRAVEDVVTPVVVGR